MFARASHLTPVRSFRRFALCALSAAAITLAPLSAPRAQSTASEASALSLLPVAVSVAAPVMLLAAGVSLTVVAVEASATGTVWVLERASDGARTTLRFSGQVAGAVSTGIGSAVLITALSTGWVLSVAGQAIAFVPNQIGASLLYNERVTR
jgi:hypothetical protein